MGITGLIPFLEKSSSKVHLKDLRGCTVAVDTYCWLHKGVFCCADKLCRGEDTDLYVTYCLKYVSMLLSYDIKPILVFDGRHLPAKALTEKRRRESRDVSRKRAAELLRLGKTAEAHSHMRRCIDVTHDMALRLIKECRLRNVDCIVAPYEADAQMAFLNKLDIAQYVITEDSDLTLFGCKKIIFKLDLTGAGLLVEADKLYLSMGCRQDKYTFDKFRAMCILSGCDYLDSLPGIGLAKACKFMLMTEEDDMRRALLKIPQYLNKRNLEVDGDYVENFLKADATFKHMYVFNPLERRMQRLNDLSTYNTDERYCSNAGEPLDTAIAFQLALGNLNPFSLKTLDNWNPDHIQAFSNCNVKRTKHKSIWQSNFKPHTLADKKQQQSVIPFALQFKKVSYSKMQEEEEDSEEKLGEDELFSMYNGTQEPATKRRCSNTDNCITTPVQVTPTKKAYNPFPRVSPKPKSNYDNRSSQKVPSINSTKRSIFTTTTTEVRSRFFASNVSLSGESEAEEKQSDKTLTPSLSSQTLPQKVFTEKIIEEMSRIEELSNENNKKTVALYDYNSPSPVRSSISNKSTPVAEVSPLTSINPFKSECAKTTITIPTPQSQIPQSFDSGISSILPTASESSTQISCNDSGVSRLKVEENANDLIELSDEEEKPRLQKVTPKKTPIVKPRALGLSKVKKTNTSKNDRKLPANQTRLSMFGFQKK
ncbi:exonuclease 1 isoform X2 [Eupeodes corollae]|nr:exonuclease 1 isoform X2 [Eupeodes corollae]